MFTHVFNALNKFSNVMQPMSISPFNRASNTTPFYLNIGIDQMSVASV